MQTNINKHNNTHAVWWHLNSRSPTAPVFEVTAAVFLDLEVCTNVPVTWLKIKQRVLEKVHNPWGWRTLPYNYMAMHTGMCHWTERGVFASLSSQCHQPVSYMHKGALTDRARQGKWLETSKARGIRRKAGRPNVLWAKIYIQRESTWEWLRSPITLLRATHNHSHVHIRELKQTAGATSTPRSWMQRPGESTSPWPAKFQRDLLSLLVKSREDVITGKPPIEM